VFYYTLVNENGLWSVVWEGVLLDQAGDLFQKGMLEEAIALCDKALALNPYSAAAYDRKAWCYGRQNPSGYEARQSRTAAIELSAKKAVALEPEDPDHYITLSLAYDASDLPELQIECYQKAIRLPTCTPAGKVACYTNISGTYTTMSKYARAIAYADSALEIDSTSTAAWLKKAWAEINLGHADSAKASIDRALATDWKRQLDKGMQFSLLFLAASIEERTRDYASAREHVLQALEMEPGDEDAQALYTRIKGKME
jgi:tetratricopeptide (TPR) repeat protein